MKQNIMVKKQITEKVDLANLETLANVKCEKAVSCVTLEKMVKKIQVLDAKMTKLEAQMVWSTEETNKFWRMRWVLDMLYELTSRCAAVVIDGWCYNTKEAVGYIRICSDLISIDEDTAVDEDIEPYEKMMDCLCTKRQLRGQYINY